MQSMALIEIKCFEILRLGDKQEINIGGVLESVIPHFRDASLLLL